MGIHDKPIFTILTPSFNRAHLLHRVYESLQRQTFRDFEWLIVDDGSTDNTREVVSEWSCQANFPIRYIWQEHGHKKKAFNWGVREAHGELLLPWDSDDAAIDEALAVFHQHWLAIPADQRQHFAGVCGLCMDENKALVGSRFPKDIFDSDSVEIFIAIMLGERNGDSLELTYYAPFLFLKILKDTSLKA